MFAYFLNSSSLLESRPACSRLGHCNGANAFPSNHLRDEACNLFLAAVVADVRHDNFGVQGETRARAVGIHSGGQKQNVTLKRRCESLITDYLFGFTLWGRLTAPPTRRQQKTRLLRCHNAPLVSLLPACLVHLPSPTPLCSLDLPSPTWNKEKRIVVIWNNWK